MIREVCNSIYHNKNLLMLTTAGIYILALFSTFSGLTVLFGFIITLIFVFACLKNLFPIKVILVWTVIFYLGIINTSARLKDTDDLLNLTPINSTIYGKIISIPENKSSDKVRFFFDVKKIEYDGITKELQKEKTLVTLNTTDKLHIYDSYKIRGRLSAPFKAGNPSQFDYSSYLRNFNTYSVFYGRNPYSMKDLDVPCYEKLENDNTLKEKILKRINNYREEILDVHSNYLKSPNLEILGGIVFGDDAVSPPEEIKQSFVNSGLLHILAASGMNVAFIFSFFFFFLNLFRINYKINISVCILAVITYILMTGLGASVVRAGLMLIFVLIGKLIDRDAHSVSLLSFVAFLMLLYNPMYVNNVGFQLSFIVTFGLLIMTPLLVKGSNRFVNWIIGTVSIPIIAQLWVIPIQIFYFNNVSVYSVFANILSVPILSVVSFGGFISSLFSLIRPIAHFTCKCFDLILNPLISVIVKISDFWGNLPHSTLQTTHPNIFQILVYYLILLLITCLANKEIREKYVKKLIIGLTCLCLILLCSTVSIPNKNLEIITFDVGNADAFLIKTPQNSYIMIDSGKMGFNGGKSQAEIIILKYLKDRGIKNIDSLIITHFDNDHCGGAADLLNSLNISKIYLNSLTHNSNSAKTIYSVSNNRNTKVIEAAQNQDVYNSEDLIIKNYIAKGTAGIGDNESSVITLVTYKNFSMLFMGDAGIETLEALKDNIPRNITTLKVGHHGANGVINKEWADYLNPRYTIISTGENKFGHPSVYTLETLRNSEILRTDNNNSIRLVVNKQGYKVQIYNPQKQKYTNF